MQTILILLPYFRASHKYLIALNLSVGTSVMAQWVQGGLPLTLTTSLIPGTQKVERENWFPQIVLCPPDIHCVLCTYAHTTNN